MTEVGSPEITDESPSTVVIKVISMGVLSRKDDLLEGGRRAPSRKWKEWGVLLTGSQLLFFRDPNWVTSLTAGLSEKNPSELGKLQTKPLSMASFQPDEVVSLREMVALYDTSYNKVRKELNSALLYASYIDIHVFSIPMHSACSYQEVASS